MNHSSSGIFAIRKGPWKLVKGVKKNELYHLEKDLKESKNLAEKHPELVDEMLLKLESYKRTGRSVTR